jgi:hypothetical protein
MAATFSRRFAGDVEHGGRPLHRAPDTGVIQDRAFDEFTPGAGKSVPETRTQAVREAPLGVPGTGFTI